MGAVALVAAPSPALTGDPADPIDALLVRTRGEVLSTVRADGGEWDYVTDGHVSRRDWQRLVGARLVSRDGLAPDVLADWFGWEGEASGFVEHYVSTCLAGLAWRADRRAGCRWEDQVRPDDDELEPPTAPDVHGCAELPEPVVEYLMRLVFGAKADYAAAYAEHVFLSGPLPADPGAEWAGRVRHKVDALARRWVRERAT